jgi:SPP1 gp7 family putative phage head morphogenesis protein
MNSFSPFKGLITRLNPWRRPVARQKEFQGGWQLRSNDGQGPYTTFFNKQFIARKVEAEFYEFLREAIPIIDAAIRRLVSVDGHITVKGDNDKLVDEIKDWIYNVPVNDVQTGLQSFHQSLSNEAFEQGFGMGEFVTDKKRSDIVGLRVADSKFIKFRRTGTGLEILQKADNDHDWRPLKPDNLIYFSIDNENQNPYGTPLFRSCEFVSKILVTMHNSLLNVWERFGDPSFEIIYKTSKKDGVDLVARREQIETEFNTAVRAKREGKSADFIRAIDTNSEIEIKVIGADGQVLELEIPARHVLEQIVAKSGLPAWMLGIHWGAAERLANFEAEMVLSDSATRQAAKLPSFYNLVQTMLLLRGRTWKPGDWKLGWKQVNLHDVVAQAQARFLNAQADMYYLQNAEAAGITLDVRDLALGKAVSCKLKAEGKTKSSTGHLQPSTFSLLPASSPKELRPFPWPELDQVETGCEDRLKADWAELAARTFIIAGLAGAPKAAKGPEDIPGLEQFAFSAEQRAQVMAAMKEFIGIYSPGDEASPLLWYYGQAYSLGLIQAAHMIGAEQPILNIIKNREIYEQLVATGFDLVKNSATKAIVNKILPEMEAHVIAGSNPLQVAARLKKLFGDQNSDWERLARTEMGMAAEEAKIHEWMEWEVKRVEFVPAPDACPLCASLAGEYDIDKVPLPGRDTHPRCRCSTRPAKSEVEGE